MAKKQKSKLNKNDKLQQVAESSKKIVKKDAKSPPAKKQKNPAKAANPKAGKTGNAAVTSPKKKVDAEELAAKLAVKKAKKAAQKLKKKLNVEKSNGVKQETNEVKVKVEKTKTEKKSPKPQKEKVPRVPDPEEELATIFVGNLPVNTKKPQLLKLFKEYEPVKSVRFRTASGKLIFKHKIRKQAGGLIAYVVLKDAETAEKALALNNAEFKGNHLRVTKSTEKGPMDPKRTVLVGNLKYSANEEKLREIFSSCGEIEYIRCLQAGPQEIAAKTERPLKSGCKGVAYVCFKSAEAVGLALELKDTLLDERPINVERYVLKKQGAFQARKELEKQAEQAKKGKKSGKKHKVKDEKTEENDNTKKPVFHGVKVENMKKKNKNKADKKLKALAKKVAPKTLLQK